MAANGLMRQFQSSQVSDIIPLVSKSLKACWYIYFLVYLTHFVPCSFLLDINTIYDTFSCMPNPLVCLPTSIEAPFGQCKYNYTKIIFN